MLGASGLVAVAVLAVGLSVANIARVVQMRSGAWSATGQDGLDAEGTALACVVGFTLGNAPPLALKRSLDPIIPGSHEPHRRAVR